MKKFTILAIGALCSFGLSAGTVSAKDKGKKKDHKVENPGKKKGHDKDSKDWDKAKKDWDKDKKDWDKDKKDFEKDVRKEIRKELID